MSLHADHGGAFFEAIGDDFAHLDRRRTIINADVLDAWYDPSPRVIKALRAHLPWLVKTSPPTHEQGLVGAIAAARGLAPENVLAGGGTSSLMVQAFRRLVPPDGKVVVSDPAYGEYPHLVRHVCHAELVRVPSHASNNWAADIDGLARAARGASLVALVNPNSPTGSLASLSDLLRLLEALDPGTWLWIDETYIDFVPGVPTVESWVAEYPRLIVAKSMSKYYALSGVRVGYLALDRTLKDLLESDSPPWSVGLVGQVAAVEALRDPEYYAARAEETRALRASLSANVSRASGLAAFPSAANFVLFRSEVPVAPAVMEMRNIGVFVRDCTSISGLFEGRHLRVAVKDQGSNERVADALREAFPT